MSFESDEGPLATHGEPPTASSNNDQSANETSKVASQSSNGSRDGGTTGNPAPAAIAPANGQVAENADGPRSASHSADSATAVTDEMVNNVALNVRVWGKRSSGLAISNAMFISIAFTLNLLALSVTPKESILSWQPLCVAAAIASGIGLLITLLERFENAQFEYGEAQRALAEYKGLLNGSGDEHTRRLRDARDKWVRFEQRPSRVNPRIVLGLVMAVALLLIVTWPAIFGWVSSWDELFRRAVGTAPPPATSSLPKDAAANAEPIIPKENGDHVGSESGIQTQGVPDVSTFRSAVELKTILNGNTTASLSFIKCNDGPAAGKYIPVVDDPNFLQSVGMNVVWSASVQKFSDETERILANNPPLPSQFKNLYEVGKPSPFRDALKQRMETDGLQLYSLERSDNGGLYFAHKGTVLLKDLKAVAGSPELTSAKSAVIAKTLEYSTPDGQRATCRCFPISALSDDASTFTIPLLNDPTELYERGMSEIIGHELEENPNVPLVRISRPNERPLPFVVRMRLYLLTKSEGGEFQLKSRGLMIAEQYLKNALRESSRK